MSLESTNLQPNETDWDKELQPIVGILDQYLSINRIFGLDLEETGIDITKLKETGIIRDTDSVLSLIKDDSEFLNSSEVHSLSEYLAATETQTVELRLAGEPDGPILLIIRPRIN